MARLRRTSDARSDLAAIWLYIAQDNTVAADRLMDEIDRKLKLALQFPLMGEAVDQLRPGTRRITVGNYQLFYEPTVDGIRLLRVYHAARRIEDLFNQRD
jgi:toxin ParE1/3/4